MAWNRLQSFAGTAASTTSVTATPGTNLSSGSTLIAVLAVNSSGTTPSSVAVKDAAGNSFISIKSTVMVAGGDGDLYLFALNTPSGDVGTKPAIKATWTPSQSGIGLLVQEVAGLATGATLAALVDGTPGSTSGTAGTTTSPTYASTAANEYLVSVGGDSGGGLTWTCNDASLTADANNQANDGDADAVIAYGNSTGGTESATWTLNGGSGEQWGVIMCAFKLAAAAPATGPDYILTAQDAGTYGMDLVGASLAIPVTVPWNNRSRFVLGGPGPLADTGGTGSDTLSVLVSFVPTDLILNAEDTSPFIVDPVGASTPLPLTWTPRSGIIPNAGPGPLSDSGAASDSLSVLAVTLPADLILNAEDVNPLVVDPVGASVLPALAQQLRSQLLSYAPVTAVALSDSGTGDDDTSVPFAVAVSAPAADSGAGSDSLSSLITQTPGILSAAGESQPSPVKPPASRLLAPPSGLAPFTVKAVKGGTANIFDFSLSVLVLDGAAEAGGASAGQQGASQYGTTSFVPNDSNSFVAWSATNQSNNDPLVPYAANTDSGTGLGTFSDNTNFAYTAIGQYTATTTAGTAISVGASATSPPSGVFSSLAAYEVPPSGASTPVVDPSTPPFSTGSGNSQVSAAFSPPLGSVLAAVVAIITDNSGTISATVTDTSGLGLTWTLRAVSAVSGTQPGLSAVYTTTVTGPQLSDAGSGTDALSVQVLSTPGVLSQAGASLPVPPSPAALAHAQLLVPPVQSLTPVLSDSGAGSDGLGVIIMTPPGILSAGASRPGYVVPQVSQLLEYPPVTAAPLAEAGAGSDSLSSLITQTPGVLAAAGASAASYVLPQDSRLIEYAALVQVPLSDSGTGSDALAESSASPVSDAGAGSDSLSALDQNVPGILAAAGASAPETQEPPLVSRLITAHLANVFFITDSDFCLGQDSFINDVSDTDSSGPAVDAGEAVTAFVTDTDSCQGTDSQGTLTGTFVIALTEIGSGSDSFFWSGPLSDTDSVTALDAGSPPAPSVSFITDSDSCAAADDTVPPGGTVMVDAYIPASLFQPGGGVYDRFTAPPAEPEPEISTEEASVLVIAEPALLVSVSVTSARRNPA